MTSKGVPTSMSATHQADMIFLSRVGSKLSDMRKRRRGRVRTMITPHATSATKRSQKAGARQPVSLASSALIQSPTDVAAAVALRGVIAAAFSQKSGSTMLGLRSSSEWVNC